MSNCSCSCFACADWSDGAAESHGCKCRDVLSFKCLGPRSLGKWSRSNSIAARWWELVSTAYRAKRLGPYGENTTVLGPVDYLLLFTELILEVLAVVVLLKHKALFQYFTIVLYLCASIAVGIGRYSVLKTAGFTSDAYLYFYYFSEALLIICLYLVLMTFYAQVFSEMNVGKFVRGGAMLLLLLTILISYHTVASSSDKLITTFVNELTQNLYFVGVVLTYLLWGAMVKLRENRTRLMQIVLSMGVYLSLFAGSYALGNLYPELPVWHYLYPLINMWLPVSWTYTFLKVPDDARIDRHTKRGTDADGRH